MQFKCNIKIAISKDTTLQHFASAVSDKGGPIQKKEEITISKKHHLAVLCINLTAFGCYDFVQILQREYKWVLLIRKSTFSLNKKTNIKFPIN